MGNYVACQVEVIGSIRIKIAYDTRKVLPEVQFVAKLKRNLISLGIID